MPPFSSLPAADLAGRRVLISNGERDPLATPALTAELVAQLRGRGAEVEHLAHPGGHALVADHLPAMQALVRG